MLEVNVLVKDVTQVDVRHKCLLNVRHNIKLFLKVYRTEIIF